MNAYNVNRNDNQDNILKESWAIFIEHHMMQSWFPNYNGNRARNFTFTRMNNGFDVPFPNNGVEGKYTPLFFDLVDDNDQSVGGTVADMPRDSVSGYTTAQLQNALVYSSTLQNLADALDPYDNATEDEVQALIDSYADNLNPQ